MAALRILVADDHPAIRRTIRTLVESHPGWAISAEAKNGVEAVEKAREIGPDVVLLDMTMPELDGLEATRQILKHAPNTRVFILTTHQSPQLTEEVMRAGASGTILKSNAEVALVAAMESIGDGAVHVAGSPVGRCRHIAAFFRSNAERLEILRSFYAEGLQQGDKELHIAEPPDKDEYLSLLRDAGVDVDRAISSGQLEQKVYLSDGIFDQDTMLEHVRRALVTSSEQGYLRTRIVAHEEWAVSDVPGARDLAEFEIRLNELLAEFEVIAVCAYDIARFTGDVILDILRSHPGVVIGGTFLDNRFYVPPDRLRAEIRQRAGR